MRFSSKFNVMVFNDNVNTRATVYLSWGNGLNPGITHLDWKRSSGWLESWKGLLSSVTDVSTTCAVAIFRVKWPISRKQKFFSGLQSRTGDDLFQSKLSISFIVYIYFNGATTSAFVTYFVNNNCKKIVTFAANAYFQVKFSLPLLVDLLISWWPQSYQTPSLPSPKSLLWML